MGRVRFKSNDRVRTKFSDRIVVPGSTKYVDQGTCLNWSIIFDMHDQNFAEKPVVHNLLHTFCHLIDSLYSFNK